MSDEMTIQSGPALFEQVEPGIGLVTLNRPDRLNALNLEMIEALEELFKKLAVNDDIRVLVLTGAGRGFCSGADLVDAMANTSQEVFSSPDLFLTLVQERYSGLIVAMRKIPQPIIAAVNGPAAGGGFALTLGSDIRVVAPTALFVASFINLGLSGGEMGASYFLPRLVGLSRAADIIYSGRKVPADEAERIGLVSKVVPEDQLVPEAMQWARTLLGKSKCGLRLTKSVLDGSLTAPSLEAAIDLENRNQTIMASSKEFLSRVSAFVK